MVEQLFTLGVAQAWKQIQALQEEFNKRFDGLHQAPAAPVHTSGGEGGEENEEEQEKRATGRQMGQPSARGPQSRVSSWFCFLTLLGIRMRMVKAVEAISIHKEVGCLIGTELECIRKQVR